MGVFQEKFKLYEEYMDELDTLDQKIEQLNDSKIAFHTEKVDIEDIDHNAEIDIQIEKLNHQRYLVTDNVTNSKEVLANALSTILKNGQFTDIESGKYTYRLKYMSDDQKNSRSIEISQINSTEDINEFDFDDSNDIEDDHYDDDYGSSSEKYGGYNGYSDDAIDDAFEGDPMNTWNVD